MVYRHTSDCQKHDQSRIKVAVHVRSGMINNSNKRNCLAVLLAGSGKQAHGLAELDQGNVH